MMKKQTALLARLVLGLALGGSLLPARAASVAFQGTNLFAPITIPAGLNDVAALAAGRDHLLALRRDGTVLGFGHNGDGRATPPPGLSGVAAIAAGIYDSLALKNDGSVVAWGFGGEGMTTPPSGLREVAAIAAGGFHNLALLGDGTIVGWGYPADGRTKTAGLGGMVAIAAGRDHSVALRSDGSVVAWGRNDLGQTNVPPGLAGVTAIAAGSAHTLALRADGSVVAWGLNNRGQCAVPPGLSNVAQIAAGNDFSLALTREGRVVGWGDIKFGQAVFPVSGLSAIAAGGTWSAALVTGDGLRFTAEPASQTWLAGGAGEMAAAAAGPGNLSYQWFFDGQAVPGATNATLTVGGVGTNAAGSYRVQVSDGANTITSTDALVRVASPLAFQNLQFDPGGGVALAVGDPGGRSLTSSDTAGWALQVSGNLIDWTGAPFAGGVTNGLWQIEEAFNSAPRRFYRLILPQ
jgi:hypothetical protein